MLIWATLIKQKWRTITVSFYDKYSSRKLTGWGNRRLTTATVFLLNPPFQYCTATTQAYKRRDSMRDAKANLEQPKGKIGFSKSNTVERDRSFFCFHCWEDISKYGHRSCLIKKTIQSDWYAVLDDRMPPSRSRLMPIPSSSVGKNLKFSPCCLIVTKYDTITTRHPTSPNCSKQKKV